MFSLDERDQHGRLIRYGEPLEVRIATLVEAAALVCDGCRYGAAIRCRPEIDKEDYTVCEHEYRAGGKLTWLYCNAEGIIERLMEMWP